MSKNVQPRFIKSLFNKLQSKWSDNPEQAARQTQEFERTSQESFGSVEATIRNLQDQIDDLQAQINDYHP